MSVELGYIDHPIQVYPSLSATGPQGFTNLEYHFTTAVTIKNSEITFDSGEFKNAIFNVSAAYGNNTWTYEWIDGTIVNDTIPDGVYDIDTLGQRLQFVMSNNFHYTYINDGVNNIPTYYLALSYNLSQQCATLTSTPVPTGPPALIPAGATWNYPVTPLDPQLKITNQLFGNLIGFNTGVYPNTSLGTIYQVNSSFQYIIEPYRRVYIKCLEVNGGKYSNQNLDGVLYVFQFTVPIGQKEEIINQIPLYYRMIDSNPQGYQTLHFQLVDYLGNPLAMNSPYTVLRFKLRERIVPNALNTKMYN